MYLIEKIAAFSVPLVVTLAAVFMLFSKKVSFDAFGKGAEEGIACAFKLIPTLCVVIVGTKMLMASGAADFLAELITPVTSFLKVPSELITLLITRPFSGSASMATYSALMKELGADSFPAFCASVIMGSSDTIVYIIGIYFASVGVKRTKYALPVAFLVMLFCIFFGCAISRVFYK